MHSVLVVNDWKRCWHLSVYLYLFVDAPELPGPACVVEERSEVKAVVVGAVALCMVGRRHCGHLVAVHRVHPEEVLHLLGHLKKVTVH